MRVCRFLILLAVLGLCAGAAMAATPLSGLAAQGAVTVKFQPSNAEVLSGVLVSDGGTYSAERGYGWDRDLRGQTRRRKDGQTGVALIDRTISQATFTVDLPDGDYVFRVKAGDSEFASGLAIVLNEMIALPPVQLRAGEFVVQEAPITSMGGKARITFIGGQQGRPNSMIDRITITPASADPAKWLQVSNAVAAYQKSAKDSIESKQARRMQVRAAYAPITIRPTGSPRQSIDLAGKWLFMPSQELGGESGADPKADDKSWHVLGVPQFWNPIEWWIYTSVNGTSHNYLRKEIERCEQFTFDYGNTSSGWYRQWIDVPASMSGRRLVLKFDAVAAMAQVYWNGKPVRNHVGMFGPFECEVTPYVKFGQKNLLAVMVAGSKTDPQASKDVAAVAVTVQVTKEMLNSLPHGCYKAGMAGIWQPVRLEITGKDRIADVYFQPTMDSASITTDISRKSPADLEIRHTILDDATGRPLKGGSVTRKVIPGEGPVKAFAQLTSLKPKLWSPEHPNLYRLRTQLVANGKVVDEKVTTVGFKTFEARGNRLYLNGKPYFLRGANQPPHGLEPNNKALADRFMKLMHDGNTMATRFHVAPPSQVWLDAADRQGVGASVGEDWPWALMGNNPLPDRKVLDAWKSEFAEIVRADRNHPSIMIWTISNESYFQGTQEPDKARRKEKYRVFSDIIKNVRALDPDAQVVLHSGYVRPLPEYNELLKPDGLDDGDIDDTHEYFGWYGKHPFRVDVPKDIEQRRGNATRPLISQEASTGYPDNDTGHPTESYIRDHYVPQAWVGKYGTYAERPDMFLDTHAQITKEYAETIRRNRTFLSGWMLFANTCWFKDVYDAERITPYPVYGAVRTAYQPVLVSLALSDRHFEAGQKFKSEVVLCNDDPDRPKLANLTLRWRIFGKSSDMGIAGTVAFPDCAYDKRSKASVEFTVPTKLPRPRSDMTLELQLFQGDVLVSRNDYPLICAARDWYSSDGGKLLVLESDAATSGYLSGLGFKCESVRQPDFSSLATDTVVVVGASGESDKVLDPLNDFVKRGGRVLFLGHVVEGIPNLPDDKKNVDVSGDFADVLEPALLDGMDPMDMHWWNAAKNDAPRVCSRSYQFSGAPGIRNLAQHIQPHAYLHAGDIVGLISWPVFEYGAGKGRVIVSSLRLADDPISKRFTVNLIRYLQR